MIYDQLRAKTDLTLQLDTFWAYAAKRDPLQLMDELKGRLTFIHLKDGFPGRQRGSAGAGHGAGKSRDDKALAMNIPMIVESETLTPSGTDEARACIEYLKSLNK